MGLHKGFDASQPPSSVPAGCEFACGYVGGNTPHVWTKAQWQSFKHLRQFPIYVPFLGRRPESEADAAIAAARAHGWSSRGPHRRALVGDMESSTKRAWWTTFAGRVHASGFVPVAYGSLSTVLELAASHVWVAQWNDVAKLEPGQVIMGHQYADNVASGGTQIDLSVFDHDLFVMGGQGAR